MNLQFGVARREVSGLVLTIALTDEKILREEDDANRSILAGLD